MYSKIRTLLLAVFLIAALAIASETEVFAMGSYGNHRGGNHGGGSTHHSAPEPSTLILIGSGLVGLWAFRKKLK